MASVNYTPSGVDFHDWVLGDVFQSVPHIRSRKMFGAWGVYSGTAFFSIIDTNVVYIKNLGSVSDILTEAGGKPFTWRSKDGEVHTMNYTSIPDDRLEDAQFVVRVLREVLGSVV